MQEINLMQQEVQFHVDKKYSNKKIQIYINKQKIQFYIVKKNYTQKSVCNKTKRNKFIQNKKKILKKKLKDGRSLLGTGKQRRNESGTKVFIQFSHCK